MNLSSLILAALPSIANYTVTRIVGKLSTRSAGTTDRVRYTAGIISTSDQALVGTSLPDPILDRADWMWWAGDTAPLSTEETLRTDIDNKSQRRFNEAERRLVLAMSIPGGTDALLFSLNGRALLRMH